MCTAPSPPVLGCLVLANAHCIVVWKVTPLFAEWIASPNFLFQAGYLSPSSTALELGAGVSGVVALTLGPKLRRYIATDQDYVIRLLKHNIAENLPAASAGARKKHPARPKRPQPAVRQGTPDIETLELDWELDSVASLPAALGQEDAESDGSYEGVDVIIACDCIYNDALIEPINSTFANICRLRSAGPNRKPTLCIIAQQLRAPDVFESWLKSFHRLFHVWQVPDELLAEPLRENTGFIVHVGYLR